MVTLCWVRATAFAASAHFAVVKVRDSFSAHSTTPVCRAL